MGGTCVLVSFPIVLLKVLRKLLKGERIYFSSQFKVYFTVPATSVQKELGAVGPITFIEEENSTCMLVFSSLSPFIQSISRAGNGATQSGSLQLA